MAKVSYDALQPPVTFLYMSNIFPKAVGGAEIFGYRLAVGLRKRGHAVDILALTASKKISEFHLRDGLRVISRSPQFLGSRVVAGLPLEFFFGLFTQALSKSNTILCFSTFSLILGYPLGKLYSKSIAVRFMGGDIHYLEAPAKSIFEKLSKLVFQFTFRLSRRADCIIVLSTWMKDYLVEKSFPKEKIVVIPNGVDIPKDISTGRPIDSGVKLIYVGRFASDPSTQKKVPLLIEAFEKFNKSYPNSSLTLVGDGPERTKIVKMISELGMLGKVKLTGQVSSKEVFDYLFDSDVFVFPSAVEGMSNSLLEAVLMGLPAVATDIPPNRELLEKVKGSTLVEKNSADALYNGLLELMSNFEEKRSNSISSAKELRKTFSMSNSVALYEKVLFSTPIQNQTLL